MFARVFALFRGRGQRKGGSRARRAAFSAVQRLRVEPLEPRTLLAAPAVGMAQVKVVVWETAGAASNPRAYDQVFISYQGPPRTYVRRVFLEFDVERSDSGSKTAVMVDRLGGKRMCTFGDDSGPPRVLASRRVQVEKMSWGRMRAGMLTIDAVNQFGVQFPRPVGGRPGAASFDPGDFVVVGVDFDIGMQKAGQPYRVDCLVDIVTGLALREGTVYAFLGGPILPTVLKSRLHLADTYKVRAELRTRLTARRPLTVITHGYYPPWSLPKLPDWALRMGNALLDRGFARRDILLYNWAHFARQPSPGWAEQAGAHLTGHIMKRLLQRSRPTDIQLIGFSRGATVVSEAARRLIALRRDYPVLRGRIGRISVHYLDAHPARQGEGMSALDSTARRLVEERQRLMQDPLPQAWRGLAWADALYQRNPVRDPVTGAVCAGSTQGVNLHGRPVSGAHSYSSLLSFDLPPHMVALPCHGKMPEMYLRTMRAPEDWLGGWVFSMGSQSAFAKPLFAAFVRQWRELPRALMSSKVFNGNFGYVERAFWKLNPLYDYIPGFTYRSRFVTFQQGRGARMSHGASLAAELIAAPPGTRYLYFDVVERSRYVGKYAVVRVDVQERAFSGGQMRRAASFRLHDLRAGQRQRVDLGRLFDLSRGGVLDVRISFRGLVGWVTLGNLDLG